MILLAIDPGSKRAGYARVKVEPLGQRCHFLDAGMMPSTRDALLGYLAEHAVDAGAVERPAGFAFELSRVGALLETSYAAGLMSGVLQAHAQETGRVGEYKTGVPVLELSAQVWRRELCGSHRERAEKRGSAGDAEVRRFVEHFVRGLPKRTNEHVRDALGLALVAARRLTKAAGAVRLTA